MTTTQHPAQGEMVPDMPDWRPWYVRYAAMGEWVVCLVEEARVPEGWKAEHGYAAGRYAVVVGPVPCNRFGENCPHPNKHGDRLWDGDSLEDAERVFFEQEELLLR